MHSAAIAVTRCLSVCLSVCPYVTFVSCAKTNKDIFEIFSPCGSLAILVFPTKRGGAIPTGTPKRGRRMQGGMKKLTIFDQYLAVSHKRLQVGKCSETIYKHQILFPSIQHLA